MAMAGGSSTIRPRLIGANMKGMRVPGANPLITTAQPGPGLSLYFARRWRERGISRLRQLPRRAAIWERWSILWVKDAWAISRKSSTGTRRTGNEAATRKRGARRRHCEFGNCFDDRRGSRFLRLRFGNGLNNPNRARSTGYLAPAR